MNQPDNAIVVGVGLEGASASLAFAATEARRAHRPVHLVHVFEVPAGEGYGGVQVDGLGIALKKLETALATARAHASGEIPVTGEVLQHGQTVNDLIQHSANAAMIVLEHRHQGMLRRLFTGSFVNGVAARAAVPVVSVREDWDPTVARPHIVTAAVQDPHEAGSLLTTAYAEAQLRGAHVVVLHAWWLASGYDCVVVDQSMRDEQADRFREELTPVLDELKARFPEVHATVQVRHAPPVEAMLDAAAESELLVIGRRHHLLPLGSHLGPVARATLDRAACPVLLTPEGKTAATPRSSPRGLRGSVSPAGIDASAGR